MWSDLLQLFYKVSTYIFFFHFEPLCCENPDLMINVYGPKEFVKSTFECTCLWSSLTIIWFQNIHIIELHCMGTDFPLWNLKIKNIIFFLNKTPFSFIKTYFGRPWVVFIVYSIHQQLGYFATNTNAISLNKRIQLIYFLMLRRCVEYYFHYNGNSTNFKRKVE